MKIFQPETDFTRIAHALTECLAKCDITGRQHRVMHAIIRKTYGYQKESDFVTGTQICKLIEYDHRKNINTDIRELKARKMLIEDGKNIGINPNLDEWEKTSKSKSSTSKTKSSRGLRNQTPMTSISNPPDFENKVIKTSKSKSTKEKRKYTKEINTKERETTVEKPAKKPRAKKPEISFENLPQNIALADAEEWLKHRREIRKPATQRMFDSAMRTFSKAPEIGIPTDMAINHALDKGWQGVALKWLQNALNDGSIEGLEPHQNRNVDSGKTVEDYLDELL